MKKIILLTLAIVGVGVSIYFIYGTSNETPPTPEPTLPGEKGTTFSGENLLKGIRIQQIGWNGEYWLIELSTKAGGMLVKYDGESFEFLLSKVRRFKWNEEYWLITLMDIKEGGAVKYDGESFEYISIPSSYGAGALEWNGEYWLIGTVNDFEESKGIVRYDGSTVMGLSEEFQDSILGENENTR